MRFIRARADTLRLDCDDTGWQLVCDTDEGDTIVIGIQAVAFEFAGSKGLLELLDWRREGEQVERIAGQTTVDELLEERYGR